MWLVSSLESALVVTLKLLSIHLQLGDCMRVQLGGCVCGLASHAAYVSAFSDTSPG